MRGLSRTGPVGRPAELPVIEPVPAPEKVVPGSRTGTVGEFDEEPPLDELPPGNEEDVEPPEFTPDAPELPPPKIPPKSGPS